LNQLSELSIQGEATMAEKKEKKAPTDRKHREIARKGGKEFDGHEPDEMQDEPYNVYAVEGEDDPWHDVEPGSAEDPMVIEGRRKYDDDRGGGRGQVGQGNQSGARGTNN
jgi:hypothetical protein